MFHASSFRDARDNRPTQHLLTWQDLVAIFTTWRLAKRTDKENGRLPAWSPTEYAKGATRGKDNVLSVSCLVLDYDDGTTIEAVLDRWLHWPCFLHTSWSHTPDHHKARLIVPLEVHVPVEDWPLVWAWAYGRDDRIDRACSDPSRLYYLPCLWGEDHPHKAMVYDEPSLLLHPDVEDLRAQHEKKEQRPDGWGGLKRKVRRARAPSLDRRVVRQYRDLLKVDPAARTALASAVGGRIKGDRAVDMTCPDCGRVSVWFPLLPSVDATPQAMCNHRNSCGWTGWLDELETHP